MSETLYEFINYVGPESFLIFCFIVIIGISRCIRPFVHCYSTVIDIERKEPIRGYLDQKEFAKLRNIENSLSLEQTIYLYKTASDFVRRAAYKGGYVEWALKNNKDTDTSLPEFIDIVLKDHQYSLKKIREWQHEKELKKQKTFLYKFKRKLDELSLFLFGTFLFLGFGFFLFNIIYSIYVSIVK